MATTAGDMVRAALRLCQAFDAAEDPEPHDNATGLGMLNDMLWAWNGNGICPDMTADLALTDEVPVENAHRLAVRYNLAVLLAPEYGDVTAANAALAVSTMTTVRAFYAVANVDDRLLTVDTGLLRMPSGRHLAGDY